MDSEANRPTASRPKPATVSSSASGNAKREVFVTGSATSSRSAATGGTRVARRAGARLATSVTTTPTRSATMIVRGSTTVPEAGTSNPIALKSAFRPAATRTPSARPMSEPITPRNSPSPSTERRTCARDAPSVRSRANSRARCVTVIEKVLKMMKAPTKTEMPANASSVVVRKPNASRLSFCWVVVSCWPVRTSTPVGTTSRTASRSSAGEVPSLAAMSISSYLPSLPVMRAASSGVRIATEAPPNELTPAMRVRPTISKVFLAASPWMAMRLPSCQPCFFAVASSMATWSASSGGPPPT